MPARHFARIRSLYLNAKAIAPHTSFTGSMAHLPPTYRARFAHLATGAASGESELEGSVSAKSGEETASTTDIPLWHAACAVIAGMQALRRLRMQLCYEAFASVLDNGWEDDESFVFGPLVEIARTRELERFEVEVDWTAEDGAWLWRSMGKGKGQEKEGEGRRWFELVRVGPK